MLLRKFSIAVVSVMLAERPLMQAFTSGVILSMALLLHALQLPFEAAEANRLETLSLCASLMVLAFVGMAGADHTRQTIGGAHVNTMASANDAGFAVDDAEQSGASDSAGPLVLSDPAAWRSASVWLSLLAVAVNIAFFISVFRTAWPHARTIIRNIRRNSILARQGTVRGGIGPNKQNLARHADTATHIKTQPVHTSADDASSTPDIARMPLPTVARISPVATSALAPAAVSPHGAGDDVRNGHPLSPSTVFDSVADTGAPAGSILAPRHGARLPGGGGGGSSFRLLYTTAPRRLRTPTAASASASMLQSPTPISPSLGHGDTQLQMAPLHLPANAVRL